MIPLMHYQGIGRGGNASAGGTLHRSEGGGAETRAGGGSQFLIVEKDTRRIIAIVPVPA